MPGENLSQDEIDALLRSAQEERSTAHGEGEGAPAESEGLSSFEQDVLAEVANIAMGAAATAASDLLSRKVVITTPEVRIGRPAELLASYRTPVLVVSVRYLEGLQGTNIFLLRPRDAAVIADLMMGNDGKSAPAELSELHLSAVTEAMNQMMGASATAMSEMFRLRVDISPPEAEMAQSWEEGVSFGDEQLVGVSFRLSIDGLVDSDFIQLLTPSFARTVVQMAAKVSAAASAGSVPAAAAADGGRDAGREAPPPPAPAPESVPSNLSLELIKDIPVEVSASLGEADMRMRDVLRLTAGAVIHLNTHVDSLVRVYANGVEIALGEVVAVGDNYGVRIKDIVGPARRLDSLRPYSS